MKQTHSNLVFQDAESAKSLKLINVVGRFENNKISFLNDHGVGLKHRALESAGVGFKLSKVDSNNNYYIVGMADGSTLNSSAVSVSESAIGHVIDKENDIDYENEMVRVPHKDFMDNYLDDAMELVVTTNALDHFHTVGMVSVDGNVYALEPEYESVSDFDVTFVGDESDSEFVNDTPFAPYAEIDISTMKARELIDLTRMLAIEDGDAVDNAVTITQPQVTVRKPITNSNASPSHKSAAALATAALQESGVTFDTAINVSTADMIAGALR